MVLAVGKSEVKAVFWSQLFSTYCVSNMINLKNAAISFPEDKISGGRAPTIWTVGIRVERDNRFRCNPVSYSYSQT